MEVYQQAFHKEEHQNSTNQQFYHVQLIYIIEVIFCYLKLLFNNISGAT